ncbi:hypothetical protein BGZ94_008140 [Podila epigama]|nr:hypothetical protein BGZ94_008140 [Podila epigama]
MSSKPDASAATANGNKTVIRYSQEFLLACAKSPLVEKPAGLPSMKWFVEIAKEEPEPQTRRKNNSSNGSASGSGSSSKSPLSDRIVLGPPKMSFASSSLGGLKRSDDSFSGFKKSLETPRESRVPRGPPSALEHGFGRDTIEKLSSHKLLPKVTPKDITGLLSGMDRRRPDGSRSSGAGLTGSRQSTTSSGISSKFGSSSKPTSQFLSTPNPLLTGGSNSSSGNNNSNSTNNGISSSSSSASTSNTNGIGNGSSIGSRIQPRSDAPEWMNYNPETETSSTGDEGGESNPQAFVDDIQAWKARMKEHERREKEKENGVSATRSDPKAPSRADTSASWRSSNIQTGSTQNHIEGDKIALDKELLGLGASSVRSLHLANEPIQDIDMFFTPGAIDLSKPFESTSAFDKFFSQHASSAAASVDSTKVNPTRKADGSRFARFFTEDEPEPTKDALPTHQTHQTQQTQQTQQTPGSELPGKQLSLDQLFRSHAPNTSIMTNPPSLGRMPSEAEILQSLNATRSPVSPVSRAPENDSQSEDAFAFQKIMAALSKTPVGNGAPLTPISSSSSQSKSQLGQLGADELGSESVTSTPTSIQQDPSVIAAQPAPAPTGEHVAKVAAMDAHVWSQQEASLPNGSHPVTATSADSATTVAPLPSSVAAPAADMTTPALGTSAVAAVTVTGATSQEPLGSGSIASPTPSASSDTARPTSRPVQVAFGGGIPTSVYRQLSGKTDGQKSGSPLIRPLTASNSNGTNMNGGVSPSLSSPSIHSPRMFNAQAAGPVAAVPQAAVPQSSLPAQRPPPAQIPVQVQQQHQQHQQHPMLQPHMNKNFPYNQGPAMHSPVMDPRLGGMYANGVPSPVGVHSHLIDNEPPAFFNGVPMQRPTQDMPPPPFGQQMPSFNQQMHVNGPGDFMPPHPSQFVGMPPPFGGHPMHPGMFPMNPVEMLMHHGPGGMAPPRPMPGMGPGPGPNHFVPNNYGHPMAGMPHQGMPMNPQFFPPQVSKPMMTREEFERRNRQQ